MDEFGNLVIWWFKTGAGARCGPVPVWTAGAALRLTAQGGGNDVTFVDTVALTYPHKYAADGDALRFTAQPGARVTITGFSNNQVRVMDVTDPANVTALEGTVAAQPGGGYSIAVVPLGLPGR